MGQRRGALTARCTDGATEVWCDFGAEDDFGAEGD